MSLRLRNRRHRGADVVEDATPVYPLPTWQLPSSLLDATTCIGGTRNSGPIEPEVCEHCGQEIPDRDDDSR